MNLPVYHHINFRNASLEDLNSILSRDMNLKHPVALNLKYLLEDEQREIIGLIENFFVSNNISYKFPYPVYLITDHESTITRMPTVFTLEELPKFFSQKTSKMNVKESHLMGKNRLLQQEIQNADSLVSQKAFDQYAMIHKKIYELEEERKFYRGILNQLVKGER
jgi:hypothetical protein